MPDDDQRRAGSGSRRGGQAAQGADRLSARAPQGRGEPAGIERARRTPGAPPRPGTAKPAAPRRPNLPDEEPHLPRAVRREIERVLGPGERAQDVALALSVGSDAIDAGRIDVAIEALAWAKHGAPRVPAVREAHGVARYLDEDWAGALTELQAYRRMSGRSDQNHLIADCLRGLGRELERITEPVEELLADDRAAVDRQVEGVIVWAGALADDGQVAAARALIRRHLQTAQERLRGAAETARVRLLVVAAELAARDGDAEAARAYRNAAAEGAPELVEEALDAFATEEPGAEAPDVSVAGDDAAPTGDDT